MAKKKSPRTYEEVLEWFRTHGFDLLEAPGVPNRVFLKKRNCSAAVEKGPADDARIFAYPGCLVNGEIAKLVNRGYQQFLKTTKTEIPATAERLKDLHQFVEEFKEALALPNLYNESLGTTSGDYVYDRVNGRDLPAGKRPKRPWENAKPDPAKKQG
jgi:hypothetical protein